MESAPYCPACSGHGTNVHECADNLSVVVPADDLEELLDALDTETPSPAQQRLASILHDTRNRN